MNDAIKYTEAGRVVDYKIPLLKYMKLVAVSKASEGRPPFITPDEWEELVRLVREL